MKAALASGRLLRTVCYALALTTMAVVSAGAQPVAWEFLGPDSVEFERDRRIDDLTFRFDISLDNSADTLYTAGRSGGVRRLSLSEMVWSDDLHRPTGSPQRLAFTTQGFILGGAPAGGPPIDRSTDGGRTWEEVFFDGINCLFRASGHLGNAVYACTTPRHVYRSFDGAAGTWEQLPAVTDEAAARILDLTEVPPSDSLPSGRLVAAVASGVAYSDDAGQSWTESALWYPFRWWVNDVAPATDPAHPFGGTVYAGVQDFFTEFPEVWASEDGGQTWTRRASGPEMRETQFDEVVVLPGREGEPTGTVWAGLRDTPGGPVPSLGEVLRSVDGGRTWMETAGAGWGGWAVRALAWGRDGRLYAGTDGGVYRTVEAAVSTEEEPAEPGKQGVELGAVYPNPSDRAVTVPLVLSAAAEVRVVVFDVLGREVAVLHEGPLTEGAHDFRLSPTTLPSGLYLVRATGDGVTTSRRVTVTR